MGRQTLGSNMSVVVAIRKIERVRWCALSFIETSCLTRLMLCKSSDVFRIVSRRDVFLSVF